MASKQQIKNLKYVFEPKSIALFGASPIANKVSNVILKALKEGGFPGELFLINPKYQEVASMKCYPRLSKHIDCAIIATPAQTVVEIIKQCVKWKVRGIVLVSAGFSESGEQGKRIEDEIRDLCNKNEIALIGPNCVEGKARVMIKENGLVSVQEIGTLVNKYFEKYQNKVKRIGETYILDLIEHGIELSTISMNGNKSCLKKIKKLFKRVNVGDIYEIEIFGKKKFKCSGDHPFLVRGEYSWRKILCKELSGTELIPCINNINLEGPEFTRLYLKETIEEINEGVSDIRYLRNGQVFERNGTSWVEARTTPNLKNKIDCFYWKHGQVGIPTNLEINEDLCRLLGFFIADGNYGRGYLKIGYVEGGDEEGKLRESIVSTFIQLCNKNFGKTSKSKEIKFGRKIGSFLFERVFGIPRYAENKTTPNFIFSTNRGNIVAFLSGLLSGDGGVYSKGHKQSIYFFTTSEDLQYKTLYLLNLIGIEAYPFTKARTMCYFKGKKYSARNLHGIRIDSVHYIKKLYALGFRFLSDKQNKKLLMIINKESNKHLQVTRMKDGDISYKRIKRIAKLDEKLDVYDFEVEDTHNFIINQVITSNCLGVHNPATRVDSIFLPIYKLERPRPGNIAFITQSGAVGSTIIDLAAFHGIGISKFVSYGNATVIDEVDLLEYLETDKKTKTIVAYIEGAKRGRAMFETMRRINKKKPIVALKAGKFSKSAEAAKSHTGNIAGSYLPYKVAFRQCNVI